MTEILNLAPQQEIFPINGQKKSVIDSSKAMLKSAEKAYDNWEAVPSSPSSPTWSNNTYIFEFPSNRKYISNYRFEVILKQLTANSTITIEGFMFNMIKSVRWYVGTTLIGSPYSGRALFLYLMHLHDEKQKIRTLKSAGGKGTTLTQNVLSYFYVPIVGPGNQFPFFNDNCESFPLHLLNDKNKKLRLEIEINTVDKVFGTGSATASNPFQFNMMYTYTAAHDAPIKGPKRLLYYELKDFNASAALVLGTNVQFKLDMLKAPSELSLILFNCITDANNTAFKYYEGENVGKCEVYANTDRLTYWIANEQHNERYNDRKGYEPIYTFYTEKDKMATIDAINSSLVAKSTTGPTFWTAQYTTLPTNYAEYNFYAFNPSKHSSYTDLYSFITPGINVNELQNFYLNVDGLTSGTYWLECVGVYKHELEITSEGEAILYSNK